MSAEKSSTPDWEGLAAQPAFHQLLKKKASFVKKTTVFFLVYYFAFLILVGYFPKVMKTPVVGKANWAYLFALSQFIMAWAVAYIYVKKAAAWDKVAKQIIEK